MPRRIRLQSFKMFGQMKGIVYAMKLIFNADFSQHITPETELDTPHHRMRLIIPPVAMPDVMHPPLLTLLDDLTSLVINHTGDWPTTREQKARSFETIGEVLNVQVSHFIHPPLTRTRHKFFALDYRLNIPTSNIRAQMNFRDLRKEPMLKELRNEHFNSQKGVIQVQT